MATLNAEVQYKNISTNEFVISSSDLEDKFKNKEENITIFDSGDVISSNNVNNNQYLRKISPASSSNGSDSGIEMKRSLEYSISNGASSSSDDFDISPSDYENKYINHLSEHNLDFDCDDKILSSNHQQMIDKSSTLFTTSNPVVPSENLNETNISESLQNIEGVVNNPSDTDFHYLSDVMKQSDMLNKSLDKLKLSVENALAHLQLNNSTNYSLESHQDFDNDIEIVEIQAPIRNLRNKTDSGTFSEVFKIVSEYLIYLILVLFIIKFSMAFPQDKINEVVFGNMTSLCLNNQTECYTVEHNGLQINCNSLYIFNTTSD